MTTFEHDGKTYTLKMTRAGIRAAEGQGLNTSDMAEKPLSSLGLLVYASLYSGYKMNPNKVASMLDDVLESGEVDFKELFEELSEAYIELFGLGE
jgi:hypothetical protein